MVYVPAAVGAALIPVVALKSPITRIRYWTLLESWPPLIRPQSPAWLVIVTAPPFPGGVDKATLTEIASEGANGSLLIVPVSVALPVWLPSFEFFPEHPNKTATTNPTARRIFMDLLTAPTVVRGAASVE